MSGNLPAEEKGQPVDGGPCENTDRHLWPETSDPYAETERLFVTAQGGIGINVGGYVYVKPLREWHKLAGGKEAMQPVPDPQSSKTQLPEWRFCADHVDGGTATALERFIYDNEPAEIGPGFETEADFREGLAAVLAEARADFESEPCQCAKCRVVETFDELRFTGCIFDGPPPEPFVSWSAWAAERPHKGVRIKAIKPTSLPEQPGIANFTDCAIAPEKTSPAPHERVWHIQGAKDCEKCGGAGWLRGRELNNPDDDTYDDTMTKYSCDGEKCRALNETSPHSEGK